MRNDELAHRPCGNEGFTLVELSIVLIIIGLLIAGVLKGQALVNNARLTSTIAQLKAIDAATNSFLDQYRFLPGDLPNPAAKVPNCTAANNCAAAGDGNGQINSQAGQGPTYLMFTAVPSGEQLAFWSQLENAGLIGGVAPSSTTATGFQWGADFPATRLSQGGYDVGYVAASTFIPASYASAINHNFLVIHGVAGAAPLAGDDSGLTPQQAAYIDRKIDDGQPLSGSVYSYGPGANPCFASVSAYAETSTTIACVTFIQLH